MSLIRLSHQNYCHPMSLERFFRRQKCLLGHEVHDFFLYHFCRYGRSPKEILERAFMVFKDDFDKKLLLEYLELFYKRFFSQQFKRSSMPDGPKVGSIALSPRGDWRMPSDATSRLWQDELIALKKDL